MHCFFNDNQLLLNDVCHANHFWGRLKGLLGKQSLLENEGLLIEPCNSIHTLGMKFPIAAIFLNAQNKVIHLIPEIKPGKLSPIIRGSKKVLELHPNTLKKHPLEKGSQLFFQ